MSTALAIAATTKVLTSLIDDAMHAVINGTPGLSTFLGGVPTTTASPPDHITSAAAETTQLNLFLYQVSLNSGWRDNQQPSRNADGQAVDRPILAVDLHYMLTAYSPDDYQLEMILGIGMQALHETPFLYREKIRSTFSNPPPPAGSLNQVLGLAGLADQLEMIKIASTAMNTEELSKIWTALQGKYRPSAAYLVSVVLIESTAQVRAPLPVISRNLAVLPVQTPYVSGVVPQILPFAAGVKITVTGENLSGQGVAILFDGAAATPQTVLQFNPGGASMTAALPPLPAGVNTFRVVRQLAIGAPPIRNLAHSNTGVFILQPVISSAANAITVGTPFGVDPVFTPVTVLVDPVMGAAQKISLLLNARNPPPGAAAAAFSFDAQAKDIAANAVTFNTTGVAAGAYLVRVSVDGGESVLAADPLTGLFTGPEVAL